VSLVHLAEELGYESIWAGEHVVLPSPRIEPSPREPTDPLLDPLIHLTFVAGISERMLLATGVIVLPQRNPLVLAKQVASLDVLSRGRLLLGVGAGYLEPEMTAIGVPMHRRGTRTDDYLAAMRALWSAPGPIEYHGPFVDFAGIDAYPRPAQPGGPRILIGGTSRAAFRRTVEQGHGWYGFSLTAPELERHLAGLRSMANEVRRPDELGELEISVTPRDRLDARSLEAFAAAGVQRLVVNVGREPSRQAIELQLQGAAAVLG
jgi:probable F420-dependent oxidoreductase